jgi:hypothetical protein
MPAEAVHTVELEVLPTPELAPCETKRLGRPRFLTARRFIRICHDIESGESIAESCRKQLISYRAFRTRVTKDPVYAARLKKAEATRQSYLLEWHMKNIREHAPHSWLASAWWCERTEPSRFALRRVERPGEPEQQPEEPLPSQVLEAHRRLQLALLREDALKELREPA